MAPRLTSRLAAALLLVALSAPAAPAAPEGLEAAAAAAARRGSWNEVLSLLVRLQEAHPDRYVDGRFEYLTVRALSGLGRTDEALPRLARLIASRDALEVPARFLAARLRFERGEAGEALDLLLPLLQRRGGAVSRRAARMALSALETRLDPAALDRLVAARPEVGTRERRRLQALQAEALEGEGRDAEAAALRAGLLSEAKRDDAAAIVLARELRGRTGESVPDPLLPLLVDTARAQRDLELAERLASERVRRLSAGTDAPALLSARFDLARLLGSRGKFKEAAGAFQALLAGRPAALRPSRTRGDDAPGTAGFYGRVRFNLALVLEKLDDLDGAARELSRVESEGWGPARLAALQRARLQIRRGQLDAAERILFREALAKEPGRIEGTLLLLVRRAESGDAAGAARALARLEAAARARKLPEPWKGELGYWRGRAAEARGDVGAALAAYAPLLGRGSSSVVGALARQRFLALPERPRAHFLASLVRDGRALLLAGKPALAKESLLPAAAAGDAGAREALLAAYRVLPRYADVLLVPELPDDALADLCGDAGACRLIQMGLPEDAEPVVRDARRLDSLLGCVVAARLAELADAGPAALEAAEALSARLPADFLLELAPPAVVRALAPRPFDRLVNAAASDSGVPPDLLWAVMRQESRFDREAVSPAAARGLMQLTLPAAGEAARQLSEEPPAYADLYDPARSIRLGAATLRSLLTRFEGDAPSAVAGYNAGAGQTFLWRGAAKEPAEALLASISYVETRAYYRRVLGNRLVYLLSTPASTATPAGAAGAAGATGRGLR